MANHNRKLASNIRNIFPFINWIRTVNPGDIKADVMAGISVGLILVPQSIAYAELAGLAPQYGLYASFLPVIFAALWGSSRYLSTGPVAVVSLVTASVLGTLGIQDAPTLVGYAMLLAFLTGAIQLTLGLLRMGVIVNFISHPVVIGFTNAAAIIIASSQLPKVFGVKVGSYEHYYETMYHFVMAMRDGLYWPAVGIVVVALILYFSIKKLAPGWPAILIVVIVTTLIAWGMGYDQRWVVGLVPSGLPGLGWPHLDVAIVPKFFNEALIIALIGFMESISIAKSLAAQAGEKIDANQELVGQGMANLAGSLSHGYPVSGSFSRSAVNFKSGARTAMAGVFAGLFVGLTLLFFTPLLYWLPQAVLGAVIIVSVVSLINFQGILGAWKTHHSDGIIAMITFIATLFFAPDLDLGIYIGVILSLAYFVYTRARPRIVLLSVAHDGEYRDAVLLNLPQCKHISILRFDGSLFFADADYLESRILTVVAQHPRLIKDIVLVANGINYIDYSGIEMLKELVEGLQEKHKKLVFVGVKTQIYEDMERSGLLDILSPDNFFETIPAAIESLYAASHAQNHERHCPLHIPHSVLSR